MSKERQILNTKPGYLWADNPWVWVIEFERVEKRVVTEWDNQIGKASDGR